MQITELKTALTEARELAALLQPAAAGADHPIRPAQPQSESTLPTGPYIVVLDRGWVYQSNQVRQDGPFLHLHNAQVIRIWGTDRGLGQLIDGPRENTKLDPAGTVIAPLKSVIHLIATQPWK